MLAEVGSCVGLFAAGHASSAAQGNMRVDHDALAAHGVRLFEDAHGILPIEVIQHAQEQHGIEAAVGVHGNSPDVVLFEAKIRQADSPSGTLAFRHSLRASIDGQDVGAAQRRLNGIDPFTAPQIAERGSIQRRPDDIRQDLEDAANLDGVGIGRVAPSLAGRKPFGGEQRQRLGV
jgi:hypothetical protein